MSSQAEERPVLADVAQQRSESTEDFFYFPIYLQSVEIHSDTFSKWCVGKLRRFNACCSDLLNM
jgi:hypothetical protein